MSIINEALKKAQEGDGATRGILLPPAASAKPISRLIDAHTVSRYTAAGRRYIAWLLALAGIALGFIILKYLLPLLGRDPGPISGAKELSPAQAPSLDANLPAAHESSAAPVLILSGIVYDEEKPYAIVNNSVLSVGDEIQGARLTDIDREGVKFLFGEEQIRLSAK